MVKLLCSYLTTKSQQRPLVLRIKFSLLYLRLLTFLLEEGFIRGFYVDMHNNIKVIIILLKYVNSKTYFKFKCLRNISFLHNLNISNLNYLILSTNKGFSIQTNKDNSKGMPLIQIMLV
jgi:ribosomal protein S8